MLGDYSIKEILIWIGGMLVAAAITILAVIYVVDNYLILHDPSDPLTQQDGLKPEQAPKLAK